MKTNFQMLNELNKIFKPKNRGFISEDEIELIEKTLCVKEMDVFQLRNLRDMTVMYFMDVIGGDKYKNSDKMSGIIAVIDKEIFNKGEEV